MRARPTICGSEAGCVFSKYPTTFPVAGFIEGTLSTEMAVAAMKRFYPKTRRTGATGISMGSASLLRRNGQGRGAYGRRIVTQLDVQATLAWARDAQHSIEETRGHRG